MRRDQLEEIVVAVAAVILPAVLTAILLQTHSPQREYVFIYMAVVAVIAVARGLWPALLAAGSASCWSITTSSPRYTS